jgi:hypothetical protein
MRKRFASKSPGTKVGEEELGATLSGELVNSTDPELGGKDSSNLESERFGSLGGGTLEPLLLIAAPKRGHALCHSP